MTTGPQAGLNTHLEFMGSYFEQSAIVTWDTYHPFYPGVIEPKVYPAGEVKRR